MSESTERKNGIILSYVSLVLNLVIHLLYTPLLIRVLGQSEYGLYSLSASIIGYFSMMDFGFWNAIVVYSTKYRAQEKYEEEKKLLGMFNRVFHIIAVTSVFLGLIMYFNIENIFAKNLTAIELSKMKIMTLILLFNLFISFYYSTYGAVISSHEKFTFRKVLNIIESLLKPLLMIPLLFLGFKSITLCIVITLINVLSTFSKVYFCKNKINVTIKYCGFDKKIFKTIIYYSIWILISTIVNKINWSVDNFVLGAVSGTVAISIYSVASNINNIVISLSDAISGVMLPKMSKLVVKKVTGEELTNEMIKIGRIQNYVIFLACSGLVLFGKQFITSWVGEEFSDSYYVALLLVIPISFELIQGIGLSILQAMNKYKFRSISTLIMSIFNVIISIYFAKQWGAIGAALGTCLSIMLCNVLLINLYYYKEIKINVIRFWKNIIGQVIPYMIPIIFIVLFMNILKVNGFLGFTIYGSIYTIFYIFISYFICMNEYEKNIVDKLLIKIHIRKK